MIMICVWSVPVIHTVMIKTIKALIFFYQSIL